MSKLKKHTYKQFKSERHIREKERLSPKEEKATLQDEQMTIPKFLSSLPFPFFLRAKMEVKGIIMMS